MPIGPIRSGMGPSIALWRLRRMQRHGVDFSAICCIHRRNGDHPAALYRFLRDNGVQFMQFIPVVQPAPAAAEAEKPQAGGPRSMGNARKASCRHNLAVF